MSLLHGFLEKTKGVLELLNEPVFGSIDGEIFFMG